MRAFNYEEVSLAWPSKFLSFPPDSAIVAGRPSNSYGSRFILGEFTVHNRSGGAAVIGIGGRIQTSIWTMGTWTNANYAAGTVYTDETTDAQSVAAGDVNLDTVGAANDGFIIGCDVPFNLVGLNVSQASTTTTVWEVRYSIATLGTGLANNYSAALTNLYVAPAFGAGNTGEQIIWFEPPADWVKASAATAIINRHGATVPSQYLLLVRSTTAPDTTRGQITQAQLGRVFMSTENVADNDLLNNIGGIELALPPQCDAIAACISVANPQNRVDVKYRYAG